MKIFTNKKCKQFFKRFIIILMVVILTVNIIPPEPIIPEAQAGIGGILTAPLTALTGGLAWAFQQILNGAAWVTLSTNGIATQDKDVFISNIVYNDLAIIDANVFSEKNVFFQDTKTTDANGNQVTHNGIKGIVQQWYSITRLMAIAATLVILVYVAIKIILASTGKDKAKYTELLKDWLLSLLLIFTLHYVMAAILFGSEEIVNFFKTIVEGGGVQTFTYTALQEQVFQFNDFSLVYAFVWIALLIYTLIFLVLYIKRLILICFFVVISPLIVILSTINKLRGHGSGVLDYWLKQFIANVVMQPIDALLFTIIGSSIVICMDNGQPLLALVFVIALLPMRSWMTQFFDQKADQNTQEGAKSTLGKVAGGMAVAGAVGAAGSAKLAGAMSNVKPKFKTSNVSTLGGSSGSSGSSGATLSGSSPTARLSGGGATTGVGPNVTTSKQLSAQTQADNNVTMHTGYDNEDDGGNASGVAKFDMQNPPNTAEPSSYGKKDVAKATGRALLAGAGKAFGLASKAVGVTGAGMIAATQLAAGNDARSIGKGFAQNYANISQATQNTGKIGGMAVTGAVKGGTTAVKGAMTAAKMVKSGEAGEMLKSTAADVAHNVTHPIETGRNAAHTVADRLMQSRFANPEKHEEYVAQKEYDEWFENKENYNSAREMVNKSSYAKEVNEREKQGEDKCMLVMEYAPRAAIERKHMDPDYIEATKNDFGAHAALHIVKEGVNGKKSN